MYMHILHPAKERQREGGRERLLTESQSAKSRRHETKQAQGIGKRNGRQTRIDGDTDRQRDREL